jgi:hypothetical protein
MARLVWRTVPALALVAVATAGVGGAAAGTVAGTVRHVAPDGAGAECSAAAPCALEVGIEGAAPGDEVVIAPGAYAAATGIGDILDIGPGVRVRGAAPGPGRPAITTNRVNVSGAGALLQGVEIDDTETPNGATTVLLVDGGARVDRVISVMSSGPGARACSLYGATLTNSVCRVLNGDGGAAVDVFEPSTVRNVTAISAKDGIHANDSVGVSNTIARGGASDVRRDMGTVSLTNTYFSSSLGAPSPVTDPVSSGLAFRDPAGDLRQADGSTTIDAGTTAGVGDDELDLNGNLRVWGDGPDIGAFEQPGAPSAAAGAVDVTDTGATVKPVITTAGGLTRVTVRYGTDPDALTGEVTVTAPAALDPGAVAIPLTGLGPAAYTTYHYRVSVASDGGTDAGEPASFTLPANPASAALGEASEIGETGATLAGEVNTGGAPGAYRFELTPTGGGLTIETPARNLPAADGPRPVSAPATGLAPGTEYDVVLVLTTPAAGTVRSAKRTLRSAPGTVTTLDPPPPPPGAPADTRKPRLTVRLPGAVRIGKRGVLVAKVTCDELCTLDATARLGVRGGKPARFRLLPKARITLRLRPVRTTSPADVDDLRLTLTAARRAALKALRAGRRVVVRIDVAARDAAGNIRKVRTFVQVRR